MSDVNPSFLIFRGAESEFVQKKPIQKKKRTKLPPLNLSGIKFEDALRTFPPPPEIGMAEMFGCAKLLEINLIYKCRNYVA